MAAMTGSKCELAKHILNLVYAPTMGNIPLRNWISNNADKIAWGSREIFSLDCKFLPCANNDCAFIFPT